MKTKRFVSFILCMVVLLAAVLPVSASNDNTAETDGAWTDGKTMTDALIAHWDFEGDNPLADKAGNSNGTMKLSTAGAGVENGVAYVSTAVNTYSISAAVSGDEFTNLSDEMTVYVRLAVDVNDSITNTGFCSFLMMNTTNSSGATVSNGLLRGFLKGFDTTAETASLEFRANPGTSSKNYVSVSSDASPLKLDGQTWVDVAITMKVDSTADSTACNFYISYDDGKTFLKSSRTTTDGTANALNTLKEIKLGNVTHNLTFYYDDIKIFNKVLTEEQIKLQVPGVMLHGVQTSEVDTEQSKFNVRFVGSIDSLNYHEVGFEITANGGNAEKAWDKAATCVYDTLLGKKTDEEATLYTEYTAANIRGMNGKLYALSIEGVPATGTVTFVITPYSIATEGDDRTYGTAYTVVFVDGVFSSASVYTA